MASTPASVVELARLLAPYGWTVTFADGGVRFPDNRVITLSHELTSEPHFNVPPNGDLDATAQTILRDAEIGRIASRPADLQHGVLLGRLRVVAQGWTLQPDVLGDIGSVLRSVGVISESEEDWLQSAGAAWSDPR
jgi:hypothetical protein